MRMMKLNIKRIAVLAMLPAMASLISGCQRLIDPADLPEFVQKIVVNVVSSNVEGSAMEVSLTSSPYDSTDFPTIIEDAEIQFKVNGQTRVFNYNPVSSKYENSSTYQPGDQLVFTVALPNKSTVSSSAIMPAKLDNLQSNLVVNGGTDPNGHEADLVSLTFTDDASGPNYYLLHFYYYSESVQLFLPFELSTSDAILTSPQTIRTNDGGYLFGDETFNGKERTFSVVAPAGLVETNTDIKYLVQVQSLSRDYYVYLKTLQDFRDSQDNSGGTTTLGSAVVVHSNIAGGLGIFGARTVSADTLR